MQLLALDPAAPSQALPLEPVQLDKSDSVNLVWLDLDRSETSRLPWLVRDVPVPVARELADMDAAPYLRDRGGLRWVSFYGVAEVSGRHELADLAVLFAPGLLVTIHSGSRPALERLEKAASSPGRLAPPLSRTALELVIRATFDGYDDLIDETEVEVERLQKASPTADRRVTKAQILKQRQTMIAVRNQLAAQREPFADIVRLGSRNPSDGARWINDRLEAAISGAREAAQYALAISWSLGDGSRGRRRELLAVLVAAWLTWLGLAVLTQLALSPGQGATHPLWYAGAVLGVISVLVLGLAVSRRWL